MKSSGWACAVSLSCRLKRSGAYGGYRCLFVLLALIWFCCGCASRDEREVAPSPSEGPWYNEPWARGVFGDFEKTEPIIIPKADTEEILSRGEYLVRQVAVCGTCHAAWPGRVDAPLSGGRLLSDQFGEVRAANITPDKSTGIGLWNPSEIIRALRSSIDKDGKPLSNEVHEAYRWIASRDALAISAYLLSLDGVKSEVERRELGALERRKWWIISQHKDREGYVPEFTPSPSREYGQYLVEHLAACGNCHSPRRRVRVSKGSVSFGSAPYSGSSGARRSIFNRIMGLFRPKKMRSSPFEENLALMSRGARKETRASSQDVVVEDVEPRTWSEQDTFPPASPDIRGSSDSGLKSWSVDDVVAYLSSGERPDGDVEAQKACPWDSYRNMTENDKRAVAQYLKGL